MISLSPAPQPPRCSGGELQVRAELCVVVADMCSSMVDLGRKGSRATGDTGSGKGVRLRVDQIGGEVVERWAESVQGWSSPAGFQTCTVGRDTVFTPRKKDTRQKPYPPPHGGKTTAALQRRKLSVSVKGNYSTKLYPGNMLRYETMSKQ